MIAYNVVKHNLNWEKIWPRITFKYINFQERDVIFKGGEPGRFFLEKCFQDYK